MASTTKTRQVRFLERKVASIQPSPENDQLYRPIDSEDPEVLSLAASIEQHGVKEPLVITLDGFILSGHRRYAAAKLAGLDTVPCRIEPIRRTDDLDRFVLMLREFNRQRIKTHSEKLREEIVSIDSADAHRRLRRFREVKSHVAAPTLDLDDYKRHSKISPAKMPMLEAIQQICISNDGSCHSTIAASTTNYLIVRRCGTPASRLRVTVTTINPTATCVTS